MTESNFFSKEELLFLKKLPVPEHIAIIPDGNRRWVKKNFSGGAKKGHLAGASIILPIVEAAHDLGVKTLTFYSFSTENWSRPKIEIRDIFSILIKFLRENRDQMVKKGVKFGTIGDLSPFSQKIKEEIEKTKEATSKSERINLVLALNYGARDEIKRAVTSIISKYERGMVKLNDISEKMISDSLDTASFVDPDLLIRAGGENRFSNFLLWQLVYTEFYSTDILWPDFTPRDLFQAVIEFQRRTRRMGK